MFCVRGEGRGVEVAPPLLLLRRSGCARCDAGEDEEEAPCPELPGPALPGSGRVGRAGLGQCQVALGYWMRPAPMLTDPNATCAHQLITV